MGKGLERARRDLAEGRPRLARERLKGPLASYRADTVVRRLLAEAYRRDGQPTEAGRWGFLDSSAATDREREAFLKREGCPPGTRMSRGHLRYLLKYDDNLRDLAVDPAAVTLLGRSLDYGRRRSSWHCSASSGLPPTRCRPIRLQQQQCPAGG